MWKWNKSWGGRGCSLDHNLLGEVATIYVVPGSVPQAGQWAVVYLYGRVECDDREYYPAGLSLEAVKVHVREKVTRTLAEALGALVAGPVVDQKRDGPSYTVASDHLAALKERHGL